MQWSLNRAQLDEKSFWRPIVAFQLWHLCLMLRRYSPPLFCKYTPDNLFNLSTSFTISWIDDSIINELMSVNIFGAHKSNLFRWLTEKVLPAFQIVTSVVLQKQYTVLWNWCGFSLQLFVVLRVVDFLVFGCGGETKIGCSVLSATFVIATKELFTRIIKYIWVLLYWKEQLNFYAIICSYKLFHWVEEEILIYFPQSLISLKDTSPGPFQ